MQRWLQKGYAVYSVTNRGTGESCFSDATRSLPACAEGWVHLMDPRFEIRDTQIFLGKLVNDGVISPSKIAATGGSYGGSQSMHLAVLKDRMMMPDGSLVDWTSPAPENTPMSLAVATPNIPWTDLIQALAPNGDTLDYLRDGSFTGVGGVMKESYVTGLYGSARNAPLGVDPSADLQGWKGLLDAGEPYTGAANEAMFEEITKYHSSYYVDSSQAPAPLLMSSGFTDDLFPVDEVIRYYNRTRAKYPNAPMSIFAGSFGHARGQTQANVLSALRTLEEQWIDHYLKDVGPQPPSNVTAYTQTCPNGDPGEGPYTAPDWASLAPGEIVLKSRATQTIAPDGGDTAVSALFNPLTNANPCTPAPAASEPGTANYVITPQPTTSGMPAQSEYTVLGSATVIAKIDVSNGPNSQLIARLVDIDDEGNKTLVARGSWRPKSSGFQVFQLHPAAWKVAAGHSLRLELLPKDAAVLPPTPGILKNYARPSNDQQPIKVSYLEVRVPTLEAAGGANGLIREPARKVLPARPGAALAPGYGAIGSQTLAQYAAQYAVNFKLKGKPTVKGRTLTARVTCPAGALSCRKSTLAFKAKGSVIAKGSNISVAPGKTRTVKLNLTSKGRKLFADRKVRKNGKVRTVKGPKSAKAKVLINGKGAGSTTIRRTGTVR
jgi:predicted acyl esterase